VGSGAGMHIGWRLDGLCPRGRQGPCLGHVVDPFASPAAKPSYGNAGISAADRFSRSTNPSLWNALPKYLGNQHGRADALEIQPGDPQYRNGSRDSSLRNADGFSVASAADAATALHGLIGRLAETAPVNGS